MQYLIKIKFILFFVLSIQLCFCQSFVSKHIDITNGLPSNNVRCIFKDSRGLLWIGTENGLSLFDGKEFKTFTTYDGLAGNDIWDVIEDKNNDGISGATITANGVTDMLKEGIGAYLPYLSKIKKQ